MRGAARWSLLLLAMLLLLGGAHAAAHGIEDGGGHFCFLCQVFQGGIDHQLGSSTAVLPAPLCVQRWIALPHDQPAGVALIPNGTRGPPAAPLSLA